MSRPRWASRAADHRPSRPAVPRREGEWGARRTNRAPQSIASDHVTVVLLLVGESTDPSERRSCESSNDRLTSGPRTLFLEACSSTELMRNSASRDRAFPSSLPNERLRSSELACLAICWIAVCGRGIRAAHMSPVASFSRSRPADATNHRFNRRRFNRHDSTTSASPEPSSGSSGLEHKISSGERRLKKPIGTWRKWI